VSKATASSQLVDGLLIGEAQGHADDHEDHPPSTDLATSGTVSAERGARCHDLRREGLGEPLPARAGHLHDQHHHDHGG
jgi:hypothetical protein